MNGRMLVHAGEASKRVLALLGLPFNEPLLRGLDISLWSNPSSAAVDRRLSSHDVDNRS